MEGRGRKVRLSGSRAGFFKSGRIMAPDRVVLMLLALATGPAHVGGSEVMLVRRKGMMIKNGVEVACSGDPYCDAQPFIECCPQGPDAWRRFRFRQKPISSRLTSTQDRLQQKRVQRQPGQNHQQLPPGADAATIDVQNNDDERKELPTNG